MNKLQIPLLVILYLYHLDVLCQIARQTSLGNVKNGHEGINAINGNPSEAAWSDHCSVFFDYKKHLLIAALDEQFVGYSRSKNHHNTAIALLHVGDSRLQQNRLSLQYGQVFTELFTLGIRLTGSQISFSKKYGNSTFYHADFGFSMKLKEHLKIGFLIINLGRSMLIREFNERMQSAIISGLTYQLSEISTVFIEIAKKSQSHINVKLGIDYKIHSKLYLRCGLQTLNRHFSTGFRLRFKRLDIDASYVYNRLLGGTSRLSLIINLGETETS